jgi:hypothetical protein
MAAEAGTWLEGYVAQHQKELGIPNATGFVTHKYK